MNMSNTESLFDFQIWIENVNLYKRFLKTTTYLNNKGQEIFKKNMEFVVCFARGTWTVWVSPSALISFGSYVQQY